MTNNRKGTGEYDVGYGKPPKHGQFLPGQSGFKGRKKKVPPSAKEIVGRVRDELAPVEFNGRQITILELAIRTVFNATIKGGKVRDLKVLFELLDKYGALPQADLAAESEANAQKAMKKILDFFDRTHGIEPEDVASVKHDEAEEARIVMTCPSCGPKLQDRWRNPERKARTKREMTTRLHSQVIDQRKPR